MNFFDNLWNVLSVITLETASTISVEDYFEIILRIPSTNPLYSLLFKFNFNKTPKVMLQQYFLEFYWKFSRNYIASFLKILLDINSTMILGYSFFFFNFFYNCLGIPLTLFSGISPANLLGISELMLFGIPYAFFGEIFQKILSSAILLWIPKF